jgi:hypothetical protein
MHTWTFSPGCLRITDPARIAQSSPQSVVELWGEIRTLKGLGKTTEGERAMNSALQQFNVRELVCQGGSAGCSMETAPSVALLISTSTDVPTFPFCFQGRRRHLKEAYRSAIIGAAISWSRAVMQARHIARMSECGSVDRNTHLAASCGSPLS